MLHSIVLGCVFVWLGSCAIVSGETRPFDRFQNQASEVSSERDGQERLIGNCGAVALQISSLLLEEPVSFDRVESSLNMKDVEKGSSLAELAECAGALGFKPLIANWRALPPSSKSHPAILPVVTARGPHYVVLAGYENGSLLIFDFPRGGWIKQSVFERDYQWGGYSMHVTHSRLAYARLWLITHQRIALLGVGLSILAIFLIRKYKILGFLQTKKRKGVSKAVTAMLAMTIVVAGCGQDSPPKQLVRLTPTSLVVSKQSDGYTEGECPVELKITNEGSEPLKLIRVDSSCQCTAVEVPASRVIEPNSSMTVPVRVRVPEYGRSLATVVALVENASGALMRPFKSEITMVGDADPIPRIVSSSRQLDFDLGQADSKHRELYVRTRESSGSPRWIRGLGLVPPDSGFVIDEISATDAPVRGYKNEIERTYLFRLAVTDKQLVRQKKLPFQFKIPVLSSQEEESVSSIDISVLDSQRLLCFPSFVMFDVNRDLSSAGSKRIWVSHGASVENATNLSVVSTNEWLRAEAAAPENVAEDSAKIGYIELTLAPLATGSERPKKTRLELQAIASDGTRLTGFIDVTFRSSDSS